MKMSDLDDFIGRILQKHPKNYDFTPGFGPKMQFEGQSWDWLQYLLFLSSFV